MYTSAFQFRNSCIIPALPSPQKHSGFGMIKYAEMAPPPSFGRAISVVEEIQRPKDDSLELTYVYVTYH